MKGGEVMKRKRGRPTVSAAHGMADFEYLPDATKRTQASHFYCAAVFGILEAASDIPHLDGIFAITKSNGMPGLKQKTEIIEQLGRMKEQDGYSDSDVLKIARIAAKAYNDGCTVKEIKAYILRGRTKGEW